MNPKGTDASVVRIRVIATHEMLESLVPKLAAMLQGDGFEMIEWSASYPCFAPDEDKEKLFLMVKQKGD